MMYQVQVYKPYVTDPHTVYSWSVTTSQESATIAALDAIGRGYAIHTIKLIEGGNNDHDHRTHTGGNLVHDPRRDAENQ